MSLDRVASRGRYLLAGALLLATLVTTTTLGAVWHLASRTDRITDLPLWFGPATIRAVWTDSSMLAGGLAFSIPVLFILICHELGHYLTCRVYRLAATLPYFLPAPFGLGTLGAFIRIRTPIRNKQQLFDVGISGPIAGFAALVPFLLIGVKLSAVATLRQAGPEQASALLLLPGRSLAVTLVTRLFHGPLAADQILDLHPFALAAWVGLLATSLNLLPLGQLDGGHILYAVFGAWQRRLAIPLLVVLAVAGWVFWQGWWVWCAVILFMGIYHPRVVDESAPLDRSRRRLAVVALLLFILCFMPLPIELVPVL